MTSFSRSLCLFLAFVAAESPSSRRIAALLYDLFVPPGQIACHPRITPWSDDGRSSG
jgi:hypothetical protein